MIRICSIASGSNGNCYYIEYCGVAVLIDCGIFYKRLLERATRLGIDLSIVKYVFISHEHSDHVRGARVVSKKLNVPIYFTQKTFEATTQKSRPENPVFFDEMPIDVADGFRVVPIKKSHNAADPYSFVVEVGDKSVGVFTDIGTADRKLMDSFSKCDAVFLESNYDETMLINGKYPDYLKLHIAGDTGHLSNNQDFMLLSCCAGQNLTHVIISHVSQDNNTHDIIKEKFKDLIPNYQFSIAPRYSEGIMYEL